MAKALDKHCGDVYYLGPLPTRMERITRFFNNVSLKVFGKGYAYEHSILLSYAYARIIKTKLKEESFDVIFAPVASTELSLLSTDIPIIYTADATFSLISNYYPDYFSRQLKVSWEEGNYIEQSAIHKADLLLYPSYWAANSAINDYRADESKVNIIPYGANIDDYPPIEIILSKKKTDKCHLLFLGVDWERKGGDIAFETLLELDKLGINAELTICGCIPPDEFKHERMTIIPFLDKNDLVQNQKLQELFLKNDFLLLPSRTEAYGVVFCEANAFGLPAITTDTGGISGVIEEGINGYMLHLNARGKEYANLIKKLYEDEEKYYQLIKSSRKTFEEKLNWDSWGMKTKTLINQLLK
ncbi:MAG: glycosyltransferase family 4 protein [Methanobacterium sp.]|nr:glycosyltransferase family 4 protein [Methanobacterium sp.]